MHSHRTLHIFLTLFLLGLSAGLRYWYDEKVVLQSFSRSISNYIVQSQSDFEASFQQYGTLIPQLYGDWPEEKVGQMKRAIDDLAQKPYTFLLSRGDSITFWNNNFDLPPAHKLRDLLALPDESLVSLPSGMFYLLNRSLAQHNVLCLIPIKYHFGSNKLVRPHHFPASRSIPEQVEVSIGVAGDHVIKSKSGKPIGSLSAPEGTVFQQPQRVELLLFLGFVLLYFSLAYNIAADLVASRGMPAAVLFILCSLVCFFFLKIRLDLSHSFVGTSVFGFSLSSFGTLGELLLYLGILLWLMIFFHKEHNKIQDKSNTHIGFRMVVAILNYLSVMMSVLISLYIMKELVFSSSVIFDFDNLFNLDKYNLLLIWGVIMMMGAMFLYSHKLMASLSELALPLYHRTVAIAIAGLLISLIYLVGFQINFPIGFVIFFTIAYVLAFDVFVELRRVDFYWVLIWIGLYSVYAAMVLYHFNSVRDIETRLRYAERLSESRDSIAEQALVQLHQDLEADTTISQIFAPLGVASDYDKLLKHVSNKLKPGNYLNLYFNPEVAVYKTDKTNDLTLALYDYKRVVDTCFSRGDIVQNQEQIRRYGNSPLSYRYTIHVSKPRRSTNEYLDIYLSYMPKTSNSSMVYNEVFFESQYKNLEFLDRYDFAVFENGVPVYQDGRISEELFNPGIFPEPLGYRNFINTTNTRSDLVYTDRSGKITVVVGRTTGNYWKRVYLAAGIFTILSIFMLLLAVVNSFLVKFLPDYYNFYIKTRGSLSKRIQYYTVILILLSLGAVGVLTYFSFRDSSQKHEISKKDYLSDTMLKYMKRRLESVPNQLDSQVIAVKQMLPEFVERFDRDIDIYSASGHLTATSGKSLQQSGLAQEYMNCEALYALSKGKLSECLTTEKASGISFSRRYYALRNSSLQTIAYIGIPYFLPKYNINPSNSDFIGKVLTAFVVLLVIGVISTVLISRSIIKPLEIVIDKMKQQRLEEKHEALVVDSHGEEMVNLAKEYNNLIFKIEDFTEKLKESERDKAWREMAAMVAHEIKNAMTTIRLSLQNVDEAKKTNNRELVDKFLDKAIYRNLMQVESLTRIAKDFGDFSMLQVPRRSPMNLNKSVRDIFECFEEDKKVEYVLNLPEETIHTLGDMDSFIRVIHNLMLNAKEAIPDDRHKRVEVSLYREGDRCIIKISDNGCGIPEDVQASIFKPHFSTKSSGTGLGLSICKQIVEALDGKIYFTTEKNVGTDFYVELPVVDNPDDYVSPSYSYQKVRRSQQIDL